MVLLLWLLAALVPCLLGMGALRILYGSRTAQEMSLADNMLTGGMIGIGLAEAAHLTAAVVGWSFSRCIKFLGMGLIILLLAALLVLFGGRKNFVWTPLRKQQEKTAEAGAEQLFLWIAFLLLAIGQIIYVLKLDGASTEGDITLETVNSFLSTDAVYKVNPLTGAEYAQGIPLRLKILCLPTIYAGICQVFGQAPEQVVCGIIPAFVLISSFLAYSTLARYFFPEDAGKRGLFMLLTAIVFAAGDYMPAMEGFGLLHQGFRGVTIRMAVLLPYTVGALLRKRYKLAVLCVLTECCIVWTFYGAGVCLLAGMVMLAVRYVQKWYADKGGKEDKICQSS